MLARSAPIPLQYALAFVHVEFSNTQNVKKKKRRRRVAGTGRLKMVIDVLYERKSNKTTKA